MIAIIREHNRLNGVRFSVGEFVLVFAAATLVATSYSLHGQVGLAALAAGTAVNALWVVGFGADSWRRGEMGYRLGLVLDRAHRRRLARDYPQLSRRVILPPPRK